MPRRIPDYALQFADFNMMSSIGAFIYGLSQILFLYNVIATIVAGASRFRPQGVGRCGRAGVDNSDSGAYHTFETPPAVK